MHCLPGLVVCLRASSTPAATQQGKEADFTSQQSFRHPEASTRATPHLLPAAPQAGKGSSTTVLSLRTGRGEGFAKEDGENREEGKGWRQKGKKEETKEKVGHPQERRQVWRMKSKCKHLGFRSSQIGHNTHTTTPLPPNESDTLRWYRNIFYLGNMSQNRSVSKIDSTEYSPMHSPPSPQKIILGGFCPPQI